jgi:ABC-type transport system involved in cytochrome bd biosynthesis fused ATPase/permease subunit
MGIALRNGIILAVKMVIVGIVPVVAASSQFGSPGGQGIILFWFAVLALLQSIVIMHQAKVVARQVIRNSKSSGS